MHIFLFAQLSATNYHLATGENGHIKYQGTAPSYGAGFSIWYLKAVVGLVAENGKPASFFVSARERR